MKVGFIGLGIMGSGMALNIAKAGHELVVNDIRRSVCDDVLKMGAEFLETPAKVAGMAEAIVTCVPWPGPIEAVMEGPDGVMAGVKEGALIIDTTVMPPTLNREYAARCKDMNVDYIDAPVSGAGTGAAAGTLGVMCGGEETAVKRATPVMESYASKIRHVGPIGSGNMLKLLNQCIYVSYQAAFAEGLALGEDFGFSLDIMLDMLASASGGHPHIVRRYAGLRGDKTQPGFLIHRARLFLDLARELHENPKRATPLFDTVSQTLLRAETLGLGGEDIMAARDGYLMPY